MRKLGLIQEKLEIAAEDIEKLRKEVGSINHEGLENNHALAI